MKKKEAVLSFSGKGRIDENFIAKSIRSLRRN
jgi:hypothetical protein